MIKKVIIMSRLEERIENFKENLICTKRAVNQGNLEFVVGI